MLRINFGNVAGPGFGREEWKKGERGKDIKERRKDREEEGSIKKLMAKGRRKEKRKGEGLDKVVRNQGITQLELSRMLTNAKYIFVICVKSVIGLTFEILFV